MGFDVNFFNNVLSDWNYKEIYVNDKCIYSVNSDTTHTISNFNKKVEAIDQLCPISWKCINITPFDDHDGVVIKFELEVGFW